MIRINESHFAELTHGASSSDGGYFAVVNRNTFVQLDSYSNETETFFIVKVSKVKINSMVEFLYPEDLADCEADCDVTYLKTNCKFEAHQCYFQEVLKTNNNAMG